MIQLSFSQSQTSEPAVASEVDETQLPLAGLPSATETDEVEEEEEEPSSRNNPKKKRSRRRRRPRSRKVEPVEKQNARSKTSSKKQHDAPMTKRDLYFSLHCELVGVGKGASAVARVTLINWETELVLDTFVQVPVPVTDFRGTGINPHDVHTSNTRAMSFIAVRQAVDQILRGKILVGHNLLEYLTALGLSHPATDVRDTAKYRKFLYEEVDGVSQESFLLERSLEDLASEYLLRERRDPMDPMERCIAALDLYKSFRREWEESLIQRAPKGNFHHQMYQNNEFAANMPPMVNQPPNLPNFGQTMNPYSKGQQDRSWFTLSRNSGQRYPPPQETLVPVATPAALSSQALEVLNYEHYDSASAYDSSTLYEASTDYGSSYYEDSVVSESMSSVSQEATGYQPPSSWFRFGSRKTRYSQPEEVMAPFPETPTTVNMPEPEETVEDQKLPAKYESPKYFTPPVPESNKSSSSWFTFRRPKSPGPSRSKSPSYRKRSSKQAEDRSEEAKLPVLEVNEEVSSNDDTAPSSCDAGDETGATQPEPVQTEAASSYNEKSSSWFSFSRKTKRRNSQEHTEEDKQVEPSVVAQPSNDATEATEGDDDWLQEVMHPAGKDDDQEEDFGVSWSKEKSENGSTNVVEPGSESQQTSQSTWFRFLRSAKSPRNEESRLRFEDGVNNNQWSENPSSMGQDITFNPAWYGDESSDKGNNGYTGLYMPRNRLCTESTIPTVASGSEEAEDDDSEEYPEDFVEGMEQNLAFLNI